MRITWPRIYWDRLGAFFFCWILMMICSTAYATEINVAEAHNDYPLFCNEYDTCVCDNDKPCILTVRSYYASGIPVGRKTHTVKLWTDLNSCGRITPEGSVEVVAGDPFGFSYEPKDDNCILSKLTVGDEFFIGRQIPQKHYTIPSVEKDLQVKVKFETKGMGKAYLNGLSKLCIGCVNVIRNIYSVESCGAENWDNISTEELTLLHSSPRSAFLLALQTFSHAFYKDFIRELNNVKCGGVDIENIDPAYVDFIKHYIDNIEMLGN